MQLLFNYSLEERGYKNAPQLLCIRSNAKLIHTGRYISLLINKGPSSVTWSRSLTLRKTQHFHIMMATFLAEFEYGWERGFPEVSTTSSRNRWQPSTVSRLACFESVNSPLPPHRVATSLCTYTTRLQQQQLIKEKKGNETHAWTELRYLFKKIIFHF